MVGLHRKTKSERAGELPKLFHSLSALHSEGTKEEGMEGNFLSPVSNTFFSISLLSSFSFI